MKRLLLLLLLLSGGELRASMPSGDDYFPALLCHRPAAPARSVAAEQPNIRLRTRFDPRHWSGELSKERLSASGKAVELWRASERFPPRRQIKITGGSDRSGLVDFTWDTLDAAQQALLSTSPQGVLDGYGAARLQLLRGEPCTGLEGCATLRQQLPRLGDSITARPLAVGPPNLDTATMERYDGPPGAYAAFKSTPRRTQVYAGANDGMVHAFDGLTGEERLAIIPAAVTARLSALTSPGYANGAAHRYFVDGPLVAQDVFFANAWRTVLLVSLGAGGRGLFALDVTDPERITLLWEFDARHDATLGHLLTAPTIARLHTGQWAAVLGNGIEAPGDRASLLLLDIQSGALIRRLDTVLPAAGLAMPLVTDTNGDGYADYAYAGDNLGNLWRFDLYDPSRGSLHKPPEEHPVNANAFRLSFNGQPLFRAPTKASHPLAQPITLAPAIVSHPSEAGYLIIVGSGQNHRQADRERQSLYGIWDRHTRGENTQGRATVSIADLQQQQLQPVPGSNGSAFNLSRHAVDWRQREYDTQGKLGWYIDWQETTGNTASERLLDTPRRLGELLSISTRLPSLVPCQLDIQTRLYVIDPAVGGSAPFPVFDLNGDGVIDSQDGSEGLAPAGIVVAADAHITQHPASGNPCVLGEAGCAPLSLGPRANGRQSWRVISDGTP
jgi:type IV pilus assembly protein PilY1